MAEDNEENGELRRLQTSRAHFKGMITRITNFANDPANLSMATTEMIEARKERLTSTFKRYEETQLEILNLDESDSEDMSIVEEKYFATISKLNLVLKDKISANLNVQCHTSKLPNVDVPSYDGKDFTKYTPFMDLFKAVIHNNSSLSDVQRLFYLRKFLTGEALTVIINLPLVNNSYQQALDLLKKRFDNKARIIMHHINNILELAPMQKGTAACIRTFISEVQQQLYALKNLKQPIDKWDMLLISVLSKKLDQYTNRAYQLDRNTDTLPTLEEFISFLEKRAIALEDSNLYETKKSFVNKVTNVATKSFLCPYCNATNHGLHACANFKVASIDDRIQFVKTNNLCNTCLKVHSGKCKFNFVCKNCKEKHNTLLHKETVNEQKPKPAVAMHSQTTSVNILLPTIKVRLFDISGREIVVKALLDTGSQASFATESLIERLGIKPKCQNSNIISIGNKNNKINKIVDITVHCPSNNVQFNVKCNVVHSITSNLPQREIDLSDFDIPSHIKLADTDFSTPSEISILLGADIYFNIVQDGHIKLENGLTLQNTLFGYIIGGAVHNNLPQTNSLVTNFAIHDHAKLEDIMERFWISEAPPQPAVKMTIEHQKAEECFQNSVSLNENKFQVDMPLTKDLDDLQIGDSFSVAFQRFLSLEKKFKQSPMYLAQYKEFIDEYIALGHAKVVDISNYDIQGGPVYFLAHHAVLNEDSLTTKLRVVFDGGMKSLKGVSLNDLMLNGPVVQSDLFDILLLWRTYLYTLTCDVTKMFRCVGINQAQTSLQNILWRDDPNKPLSCLQLQTITYGLKASTFLATRCLIELALRYREQYPLASQAMFTSTYVDDVITGADDIKILEQLKIELTDLLNKGGFALHKWSSNCPEVLNDLSNDKKGFDDIDINGHNVVKTLGLQCDLLRDQLTFKSPETNIYDIDTKRKILSFIGKMFDPLGVIGPIIVIAKLFMQSLWALNVTWDAILPQNILTTWHKFLTNLKEMGTIAVPRGITSQCMTTIELVGYADASIKALGCCLYLRIHNTDGTISTNLLCSKSRVAPLNKSLTIPRLELNSALLLSQVANRVFNILQSKFKDLKVFLYSDSQIVLAWLEAAKIKSDPYVITRVTQIKKLTKEFVWSHVSTNKNPADLLSRGCDPHKLKSSQLWWHGPSELSNPDFNHSLADITFVIPSFDDTNITGPEAFCGVIESETNEEDTENFVIKLIQKFSNIIKLQRVVSYILRFYNNLKSTNKLDGSLTPTELNNAMIVIIQDVQKFHFNKEIQNIKNCCSIKSGLSSLHPFLDKNEILRVGGRLHNAIDIPYEKMHPIILPKSCHLTKIIIHKEHLRLMHAGAKLVLSSLSQKFWLISGIREVKKVVNKCIKCARLKASASMQLMGSLPQDRVTPLRPFEVTGVDFCGPFNLKVARIRKPIVTKGYVAIFVCFSTKAIHIELVSDLTTEAFLACLKRFFSRRGMPAKIYCDNAKTFKGAQNELNQLYKLFTSQSHADDIENYCVNNYIEFKFIPAYSPEFGGLWEAGVKSFKHHFKRIVGNIALPFEALYTVITEIEAILNSRPLLPTNSDISSYDYLTPGHFLIGTPMMSFPEVDVTNKPINRLKFWQMLSKIKQDLWKVWSRDYLTQLQNRPKWKHSHPNLNEGDLVIVRCDNTSPLSWPMARIIRTIPGPDGKVRVAEIKMSNNKKYVRSFRKLCPLPF